jgi:hypothetical protein
MILNRNILQLLPMSQLQPVECNTKLTKIERLRRRELIFVVCGLSMLTTSHQTSPEQVRVIKGWTLREGDL